MATAQARLRTYLILWSLLILLVGSALNGYALDGESKGLGWCPICKTDQPLSHDFTHGGGGGGGGLTEQQSRYYRAYPLNEQGRVLFAKKDYAGALALFEEAHRIYPEDPVYKGNVGLARDAIANEKKHREELRRWEEQERIRVANNRQIDRVNNANRVNRSLDSIERQEQWMRNIEAFAENMQESLRHFERTRENLLWYRGLLEAEQREAALQLRQARETMQRFEARLELREREAGEAVAQCLDILERLRREGLLPEPDSRTYPQALTPGSEDYAKHLAWVLARPAQKPDLPDASKSRYEPPASLALFEAREAESPPARAVGVAAAAVPAGARFAEASQAEVDRYRQQLSEVEGQAKRLQERVDRLASREKESWQQNVNLRNDVRHFEREVGAQQKVVRFLRTQALSLGREWLVTELKRAGAEEARLLFQRHVVQKGGGDVGAAASYVQEEYRKFQPFLSKLNHMKKHLETMKRHTGSEGRFVEMMDELKGVIRSHFDAERTSALERRIDLDNRAFARELQENAPAGWFEKGWWLQDLRELWHSGADSNE